MPQHTATIASHTGLHARPAAIFAEAANNLPLDVMIRIAGQPETDSVVAGSILSVMTLGAVYGDEVILHAEGQGAESALRVLVELLETDLDAK